MLTKNFYAILAGLLRRRDGRTYSVSVIDCDGKTQTTTNFFTQNIPYSLMGAVANGASWVDSSKHGIWYGTYFGTGTTPATIDDIVLESPIRPEQIKTVSGGTDGTVVGLNADHLLIAATHYITNISDKAIAISEVGMYGQLVTSNDVPFLLDRTVLETPITVPARQTVPITYEIKFPYNV